MDFSFSNVSLDKNTADCLMLAVFEDKQLSEPAQECDKICQGYLSSICEKGDITGKLESTLLLHDVPHLSAGRILLVGCGERESFSLSKLKKALKAGYAAAKNASCAKIADAVSAFEVISDADCSQQCQQSILAAHDCIYQFMHCKSKQDDADFAFEHIEICLPNDKDPNVYYPFAKQSHAIGKGMALCKDLGNLPANICTPTYLAERAKELSKTYANMKCHIMEEKEMRKRNMNTLLSVSNGSEQPAKLITLEYHGGKKGDAPIVLVGKGVTFDSGGISLKPAAAMDEMKYDMCGAASVLGTLCALAECEAELNVVGIIPATENLPSGTATKPGDIVTSMSGLTVEILNTDAEGRLILCDALTYSREYEPKYVVDIATLTGAMVIALGDDVTGMFTGDEALATKLLDASQQTHDHLWRMPLWEPYQEKLKSPFADVANIGGRPGGSITAACFLARFTDGLAWAHLDIAGTAWNSGNNKGATGRPVPLLTQFCLNTLDESHDTAREN